MMVVLVCTMSDGATERAPRFEGWPIQSEDHPITAESKDLTETLDRLDSGAPDPEWRAMLNRHFNRDVSGPVSEGYTEPEVEAFRKWLLENPYADERGLYHESVDLDAGLPAALVVGLTALALTGCVNVRAPQAKGPVEVNSAVWKSNAGVEDEAKASVHAETDARSDANLAP